MLIDILDIQIADNQKARVIDAKQTNTYVSRGNRRKVRSQERVYKYFQANQQ